MSEITQSEKYGNSILTNSEEKILKPSAEFKKHAHLSSHSQYKSIYDFSVSDQERFWSGAAKDLHWFKPWKKVKQGKASATKWFVGGKTNISYNCLDRYINTIKKNQAALIWESENGDTRILTYHFLFTQVCKFANFLHSEGIGKGDFVLIYMGNVPEAVIAMLACSRIGAIHSVIYNGLSPVALESRIKKLNCRLIVTQDYHLKKGIKIPLKENVDKALTENTPVEKVIFFRRFETTETKINPERDRMWQDIIETFSDNCEAVTFDSQHPLFCMFTYETNGELKKIIHGTGGYMVQTQISAKWIFDLKEDDIFWTTSNIAWISAQTYGIYGTLLNGATSFMFESVPIYPEPDRYWKLISKYKINIFVATPTTLRALLKLGNEWVNKHDLSSLRLLGTKGELIRPETWNWFYEVVGKKNCPVVNTWQQRETGTILISPLPGASYMQPGFLNTPFPGIETDIVDIKGKPVKTGTGGYLVIKNSWPSMSLKNEEDSSENGISNWNIIKGTYFTSDAAIKSNNGFIKILGRVDDVIKAAGNRISGNAIENILKKHASVEKAVIVKRPDEIIGDATIAFVKLKDGVVGTTLLREELRDFVADQIGIIAKPDELKFLDEIPLLENGRFNRKLLRSLALEGTPPLKGEDEINFKILDGLREEYQQRYME
jgi:acetyl-CoA synthetase